MLDKKYAVFTMDVESFADTECVAKTNEAIDVDLLDGFDEYINLLDKYGIKGTLFTVGSLAPKIADKLTACIKNGHKIALHNYEHIAPVDIPLDVFKTEVLRSKNELSELLNTDIVGFRAPCFGIDDERLLALQELGFRYDSSMLGYEKANHTVKLNMKRFAHPAKSIYRNNNFFEFALQRGKSLGVSLPISGGGYVRLADWFFMKFLIKKYVKKHNFYVFYLHPFELTRKKIPVLKNLKSYDRYYLNRGIKTYKRHIEKIISILKKQGYEFITFEELTEKLMQEKT